METPGSDSHAHLQQQMPHRLLHCHLLLLLLARPCCCAPACQSRLLLHCWLAVLMLALLESCWRARQCWCECAWLLLLRC
jgi:hypothetical protein